jgi:hypothetical protein
MRPKAIFGENELRTPHPSPPAPGRAGRSAGWGWNEEIQRWASEKGDCMWLGSVEPYRRCRVAGVVERLRIDPREGVLEVSITDGVDKLQARWEINHVEGQLRAAPGWGLILEGVAHPDGGAGLLMEEPAFEIVRGPRHG